MASPSSPIHGMHAALYRLRPNGFNGSGLNDLTWGTAFSGGGTTAYFEVEIDGTGTPDTFQWRKNGGAWTTDVNITGAAQTLSDSQTVTFGATTGHTLADTFAFGNLDTEPCTESTIEAQITAAANRILNPNAPPTFTDDGGESVIRIDYSRGAAVFTANVGNVTVSGNNGFVPYAALEKVGYLRDWSLNVSVDMADASRTGQKWKESLPGQAKASGSANAFLLSGNNFFDALSAEIAGTQKYHLLQLFTYDPDQDQTGDHYSCWASISGWNPQAPIGDLVTEAISFEVLGLPSFTANT